MSYHDGRTCSICGAPIGDNNRDGIGGQCREVYNKARLSVFFSDSARKNSYYEKKAAPLVERFITELAGTKFKSKFWQEFYPSIVEQWGKQRFVSSKQLDIIAKRLTYTVSLRDVDALEVEGKANANAMFNTWVMTDDEREHIVRLANSLRHDK